MGGITSPSAVVISLMLSHMAVLAGTSLRLLPPELIVTEGGTVKFTCSPITPIALPILEMNGVVVFTEPRLQTQLNPMYSARGNSTYTFSNVTRQDNGTTFRCGAAGVISNTVTVRAIVPPKISGRTGPYTILEGSSRTLTYQSLVTLSHILFCGSTMANLSLETRELQSLETLLLQSELLRGMIQEIILSL